MQAIEGRALVEATVGGAIAGAAILGGSQVWAMERIIMPQREVVSNGALKKEITKLSAIFSAIGAGMAVSIWWGTPCAHATTELLLLSVSLLITPVIGGLVLRRIVYPISTTPIIMRQSTFRDAVYIASLAVTPLLSSSFGAALGGSGIKGCDDWTRILRKLIPTFSLFGAYSALYGGETAVTAIMRSAIATTKIALAIKVQAVVVAAVVTTNAVTVGATVAGDIAGGAFIYCHQ